MFCLFSPLLGEDFQFDYRIFFKWVGSTTNYVHLSVDAIGKWSAKDITFQVTQLDFRGKVTKNLWFRTLHPRKINGWNIKKITWIEIRKIIWTKPPIFRLQPLIFRGVTSLLFTGTRGWNLLQEVLLDLAESLAISMPEERPSEWEGFAGLNEFEDGRWSRKSSVNYTPEI